MMELLKYGLSIALVNMLAVLAGWQGDASSLKPLAAQEKATAATANPTPSVRDVLPAEIQQLPIATASFSSPTPVPTPDNLFKVAQVADGQTLILAGGQKVKLGGLDTTVPLNESGCWQSQIIPKQKELLENKEVRIEWDSSQPGEGFVYLSDGTLVNTWLVKEGLAKAAVSMRFQGELKAAEEQAQANQNGIWSQVCIKGDNTSVRVKQNINSSSSVKSSTSIKIENRN